jgi:hypothetical protein
MLPGCLHEQVPNLYSKCGPRPTDRYLHKHRSRIRCRTGRFTRFDVMKPTGSPERRDTLENVGELTLLKYLFADMNKREKVSSQSCLY